MSATEIGCSLMRRALLSHHPDRGAYMPHVTKAIIDGLDDHAALQDLRLRERLLNRVDWCARHFPSEAIQPRLRGSRAQFLLEQRDQFSSMLESIIKGAKARVLGQSGRSNASQSSGQNFSFITIITM